MASAATIGLVEAVQIAVVAMASVLSFMGVAGYILQAWRKWKVPTDMSCRPVSTFVRACMQLLPSMAVSLIHGGLEISVFHAPLKDHTGARITVAIAVLLDIAFQMWSILANISNTNGEDRQLKREEEIGKRKKKK